MHVPAALEQWAAEHSEQLSDDTLREVRTIAETIDASSLRTRPIDDPGDDFAERLGAMFPSARAERAATLVAIVGTWASKQALAAEAQPTLDAVAADNESAVAADNEPAVAADTEAAPEPSSPPPPTAPADDLGADAASEADAPTASFAPQTADEPPVPTALPDPDLVASADEVLGSPKPMSPLPQADTVASGTGAAPAFLRSDRIDEEDDVRLYGPKRPWKAIVGTLVALALLAGAIAAGWYWFTQRDTTSTAETSETVTATPEAAEPVEQAPAPTAAVTVAPSPTPEPTAVVPSFWADVTPILNSGSSQITSSTYAVGPSNRAVLTGHTAAITGVAISDDGRVLTSGADRRLVDWGADVTLANPDVLNVPSPLTVLERTDDQRILAGDADGNVTVIDLVNSVDPIIVPAHSVAVSALAELLDGRLAVASVDGDVSVFAIESPDDVMSLPHDVEVTGVAGLDDGSIATAAVDGILRIWPADGVEEPMLIDTLGSPMTALALLGDGRIAIASVTGDIQIITRQGAAADIVTLPGHVGAVRALFELVMPDDTRALASGGDDTTIRLWDIANQSEIRVLEGHGDIISGLDALPDRRLVSTSGDGTGRVWDLQVPAGRPVIAPHDWNLSALAAWDNDQFVTGGIDGKVVLASTAETGEPLLVTQHDAPVVGVSVLQSGDIVSLDAASVLRVNQPSAQAAGLVEINLAAGSTALDIRESLGVVTGHADGSVRFHDFVEEVAVVEAHGSGVNDVVALSNGLVASAGQDTTVRIIDPENPDVLPVFDLHTGPVDVVVELPDGRIASAGSDGIYIFTLDGLAQDHVRLNGQRSRTISLVPLPGDRLISTGDDGRVRLWDLTSPEAEPTTLIDIPGVVNPHLIQADNGLFVAGAARGYVVFTLS